MSKVIALDAGHGYHTAGKRCLHSIDPAQTREWFLNDRIMDMVQDMLGAYDCTVIRMDDTSGTKDISLSARVKAANQVNADIFISMHHNAGINGGCGGGTVVFYYSGKAERAVQAKTLYQNIVHSTGLRGNRSQPIVHKKFHVLQHTKMPAFLIENGFMDSSYDTPIILTKDHATKTAQGIVTFLVTECRIKSKTKTAGSNYTVKNTQDYYPAYLGKNTTLWAALTSLGITSNYTYRKKMAAANNITGYLGTAAQNTRMYNLLCAGKLKRV